MTERKEAAKQGAIVGLSGSGFSLAAALGACGGACSSAIPLTMFLTSIGLGALSNYLDQVRYVLLGVSVLLGAFVVWRLVSRNNALGAAIVSFALGSILVWSTGRALDARGIPSVPLASLDQRALTPSGGRTLEASVETMRERFNSVSERVRFVSILSPECGGCVKGYKVVQNLLNRFRGEALEVELVWIPMVDGDSYASAEAHAVGQTNSSIVNSWDKDRVVGDAFRETLGLKRTAWDVYLVYAPGITWDGPIPPKPTFWMHQLHPTKNGADPALFLNEDALEAKLAELTKRRSG